MGVATETLTGIKLFDHRTDSVPKGTPYEEVTVDYDSRKATNGITIYQRDNNEVFLAIDKEVHWFDSTNAANEFINKLV